MPTKRRTFVLLFERNEIKLSQVSIGYGRTEQVEGKMFYNEEAIVFVLIHSFFLITKGVFLCYTVLYKPFISVFHFPRKCVCVLCTIEN